MLQGVRNNTPSYTQEEQEEIDKIASRLDKDEIVEIIAKQSKFKPGGSVITPDTLFVTNKRIIFRNPTMLGARQTIDVINFSQITSVQLGKGVFSSTIKLRTYGYQEDIEAIPKDKAEKIVEYIRNVLTNVSEARSVEQLSLADELSKLAKLKEQGILSEAEFTQMKQELIKNWHK